MTKADFLALAGFALIVVGISLIFKPLGLIAAGVVIILLARAIHNNEKKTIKGAE